jgi:phosphate uptake regulator
MYSVKNKSILKPYKNIIKKALYPSFGNSHSLSSGKSAISAYKKTSKDELGTLELMMFYVECGNKFTVDFGDIDEQFYYSLEKMFSKILDILKKSDQNVIDLYFPRLKAVVESADGIGWGYYDQISENLQDAFPDVI